MKTLDSASLHIGIAATLQEVENVHSKITDLQKSVQAIIDSEPYLKGKTGQSIRSFYSSVHTPFLIYLYESLNRYRQTLEKLREAVHSYEPDENGLVREFFMDENVQKGLHKAEQVTSGLVDETNGIMDSVSDIVSLPHLNMEEFGSLVKKGKSTVKNDLEELHRLDHEQTKAFRESKQDLKLLQQYIHDMSRAFASDYSITSFNGLAALRMPSFPSLWKEVYEGIAPKDQKEEPGFWDQVGEGLADFGEGTVDVVKGSGIGVYDALKDTAVGIKDTVLHPDEAIESVIYTVRNPIDTTKHLSNAIATSFERDMINGDAESRAHWVSYALGTVAGSVAGTKGLGAVTKTGVATTKAGAKAATGKIKGVDLPNLLPYGPRTQLAGGPNVPYNVVDGKHLKDQLMLRALNGGYR